MRFVLLVAIKCVYLNVVHGIDLFFMSAGASSQYCPSARAQVLKLPSLSLCSSLPIHRHPPPPPHPAACLLLQAHAVTVHVCPDARGMIKVRPLSSLHAFSACSRG